LYDAIVATLTIHDDDGIVPLTDKFYTYNNLGNLTSKTGKGSYSYPTVGSAHPHAVTSTSDGQSYVYDANGNMSGTGGLLSLYDAENRPTHLSRISGTKDQVYDADGERVKLLRGSTTTVYLEGLWEEPLGGAPKVSYTFKGQMVAPYPYGGGFTYLHATISARSASRPGRVARS
jgi:hypothetical protein